MLQRLAQRGREWGRPSTTLTSVRGRGRCQHRGSVGRAGASLQRSSERTRSVSGPGCRWGRFFAPYVAAFGLRVRSCRRRGGHRARTPPRAPARVLHAGGPVADIERHGHGPAMRATAAPSVDGHIEPHLRGRRRGETEWPRRGRAFPCNGDLARLRAIYADCRCDPEDDVARTPQSGRAGHRPVPARAARAGPRSADRSGL